MRGSSRKRGSIYRGAAVSAATSTGFLFGKTIGAARHFVVRAAAINEWLLQLVCSRNAVAHRNGTIIGEQASHAVTGRIAVENGLQPSVDQFPVSLINPVPGLILLNAFTTSYAFSGCPAILYILRAPDIMNCFSNLKNFLGRKIKPGSESKGGGAVSSPSAPLAADPTSPSMLALAPPEQTVPSVPQPLDPPLASPVPEPSAPPIASDAVSYPTHDVDPWSRAYEIVRELEPGLLADYRKHLASLQGDTVASADLATPRSVESIVKRLLEERDKKQWRVPLFGKNIGIRKQA
ncbi:hypothetical protein DL768_006676 [Monosporascus sp. mg162]|nr:hypothetical protein DL768_006676 [Monosporascus sp. mg162]